MKENMIPIFFESHEKNDVSIPCSVGSFFAFF